MTFCALSSAKGMDIKMKKKLALILAGTAMAAMVLAGCGEKNNASGEDKVHKKIRTTLCIQTKINNILYKISGSMYYKTNNWL